MKTQKMNEKQEELRATIIALRNLLDDPMYYGDKMLLHDARRALKNTNKQFKYNLYCCRMHCCDKIITDRVGDDTARKLHMSKHKELGGSVLKNLFHHINKR